MKKHFFLLLALFANTLAYAQTLTDSLKAYYSFSGNAQDQSGYGHHGTVYNAVLAPDRFGNLNSAYYFDGNADYITIPTTAHLRPTTFPVSIAAWVKLDPTYNLPNIIFTSDNNSNGNNYGFWLNFTLGANAPLVSYGDGGQCAPPYRRSKVGVTSLNDNQWHLVVAVLRGATDMDLYVDCQNDGGIYQGTGGALTYSPFNIAKIAHFHCNTYDYYFKGLMDEVRFYHRELTQTDINNLYSYPSTFINSAANILGTNQTICNGQTVTLNATSSGASGYLWSTGSTNPIINVTQPGTYWVDIMGSGCGLYGRDTIVIHSAQTIDVIPDTIICKAQTLVLDATPNFSSYSWSTGATTQTISVTTAGTYYVTLSTASGCTAIDTVVVGTGANSPSANFIYTTFPAGIIQFYNTSLYGTASYWYFNGVLDITTNPQHYFPCNTPTQVSLVSVNECGSDTITQTITYICNAIDALDENMGIKISPIPAKDVVYVTYDLKEKTSVGMALYDEVGRIVFTKPVTQELGSGKIDISVANLSNGIYFLHFITEKGNLVKKVLVSKE